jgi:hypothetical protein
MRDHRDQFAQVLSGGLSWQGAATHFTYAGLKDAGGRTPTASTAAKTWRRVCIAATVVPLKPPSRRRGEGRPG